MQCIGVTVLGEDRKTETAPLVDFTDYADRSFMYLSQFLDECQSDTRAGSLFIVTNLVITFENKVKLLLRNTIPCIFDFLSPYMNDHFYERCRGRA